MLFVGNLPIYFSHLNVKNNILDEDSFSFFSFQLALQFVCLFFSPCFFLISFCLSFYLPFWRVFSLPMISLTCSSFFLLPSSFFLLPEGFSLYPYLVDMEAMNLLCGISTNWCHVIVFFMCVASLFSLLFNFTKVMGSYEWIFQGYLKPLLWIVIGKVLKLQIYQMKF